MKIAVASIDNKPNSEIANQAGKAPYFLIYNNDKFIEAIENPFRNGGGAGIAVAKMLGDKGIEKFIAGKIGPNMQEALKENKIEFEERNL